MIDLDIPTDNPPATNTLLHWLQTGLTQSSSPVVSNTTSSGSTKSYVLSVPQDEAAFASYIGPAPPAKIPLSHRYTQILVDTSATSEEELATLKTAAASRLGFDAQSVLTTAGLADKVVAGNFFNVTNPGPAPASNSTTGGGNDTSSSGSAPPTQSPIPAAAISQRASASLMAIVMVGVVFLAL
jgi:hypothetical protein